MRRWVFAFAFLLTAIGVYAQPTAGEPFFVTAEVIPAAALVGQQLSYVVTAYSDTPRTISLTPPAFGGFYQGEIRSVASSATVAGKQYNLATFAVTIYPSTAGELIIPAAEVIFEGTVLAPTETRQANPVTLTATLPLDAPEDFSGLIGRHEVAFNVDVTAVELGQPIEAEYRVKGTGYTVGLPEPELILPQGWRAYLNPSQIISTADGTITTNEKIFRWRIMPDRAGMLSIGVAPLTVFDLPTGAFLPLTTTPIEIQVLAGANGETVRVSAVAALENSDMGLPAATQIGTPPPSSTLWPLAPIGTVLAIGAQAAFRRLRATQRGLRRKNALTVAKTRLSAAAKLKGEAALRAIESAAAGYLRDKELSETPALREALVLVESVRYAPQIDDVAGLASAVYAALNQAESESES